MAPVGAAAAARQAEPVLTRIVEQDQIPWYRKRNLRRLYALLLPTCIGIEMTSGFDSQMINALQITPTWQACEFRCDKSKSYTDICRLQPPSWCTLRHHLIGIQPRRYLRTANSTLCERQVRPTLGYLPRVMGYGRRLTCSGSLHQRYSSPKNIGVAY
jgi:hypothetical protein